MDELEIDLRDLGFSLTLGRENVLDSSRKNPHLQFISNTIAELENWACFQRGYRYSGNGFLSEDGFFFAQTVIKPPKIGRNDPCSCGSGKKYKKCCGK